MYPQEIGFMKKTNRAFFLLEILAVIGIIGLLATVVSVSVYENLFKPKGAKRVAMLFASLSTHAQGWAVESGNITIMELDLSLGTYVFYFFDNDGNKKPLRSAIFRDRSLPPGVKFLRAEVIGQVTEEGKVMIPYFSFGYSNEALIVIQDLATNKIWSIFFKKFYGDTEIFPGSKTMKELAIEQEE